MSAVQPEVIEHLDFQPACDRDADHPAATHTMHSYPDCGHRTIRLLCGQCTEAWRVTLNTHGQWGCTDCDWRAVGIGWQWARIEPLP